MAQSRPGRLPRARSFLRDPQRTNPPPEKINDLSDVRRGDHIKNESQGGHLVCLRTSAIRTYAGELQQLTRVGFDLSEVHMNVHELPPGPSPSQRGVWWRYIIAENDADPDGWWLGHCPLHDKEGVGVEPTAQFNFRHGALRCLGVPCCHKKRTMSLSNVLVEMVRGSA